MLIMANAYMSYLGFRDRLFYQRYLFEVDAILVGKEYIRLLSSGFLHVSWSHFAFNMFSLYIFTRLAISGLGIGVYVLLYLASLVGGNLLALYIHRNHGDYRAVGASGAVSGVMMACVIMYPGLSIWFIPGWVFAIGYVLFSIYGIKSQRGNIGHEAHLGGAVVGILAPLLITPSLAMERFWLLNLLLIPVVVFLYFIARRPEMLYIPNFFQYEFKQAKKQFSRGPKPRMEKKLNPQVELDQLLEKVQQVGFDKLSKQEKKRLKQLSEELK